MHEDPTASYRFDSPEVSVFAVDGDPDARAFFEPTSGGAWLAIRGPLNLHEWR